MAEIEALRRQRMTGPQIARALGMARSTVGLILRRLGLGRLALLDPKPPVVRYERSRPGEMIHLDIKKLGRFDRPIGIWLLLLPGWQGLMLAVFAAAVLGGLGSASGAILAALAFRFAFARERA